MQEHPHLAFDAGQTAGAGLWLAESPAVAAAGLPGETQGVQLPLLLPVHALHAGPAQQGLPLPVGVRLQGPDGPLWSWVLHRDLQVPARELVHGEPVGLAAVQGTVGHQLQPRRHEYVERCASDVYDMLGVEYKVYGLANHPVTDGMYI